MLESLFIKSQYTTNERPVVVSEIKFSSKEKAQLFSVLVQLCNGSDQIVLNRNLEQTTVVSAEDAQRVIEKHRQNPTEVAATIRNALINFVRQKEIPEPEREQQLRAYLQSYFELLVRLDRAAFPPSGPNQIYSGVPFYIPDGLSDMGSDREIEALKRSREKIRVNKAASYQKSFEMFFKAIWQLREDENDPNSPGIARYLTTYVMTSVFNDMPYDYTMSATSNVPKSVTIDEFVNAATAMSVCRHKAMETQLRLQALGIESRLLKCDMDGVPHVANLIEIDQQWYLIDSTNPEVSQINPALYKPYRRKVAFQNQVGQVWQLSRNQLNGDQIIDVPITYSTRNNMYYRLLDNKTNPA
jgi:hypothetical protein